MDFYYHLLSCRLNDLISCLTCLIFLKSPKWLVWTFSAQTYLKFQMNLLKFKIRKDHKKFFCGASKNFNFIAHHHLAKILHNKVASNVPNNILKYFITSAKTLRSLSYTLNTQSLKLKNKIQN